MTVNEPSLKWLRRSAPDSAQMRRIRTITFAHWYWCHIPMFGCGPTTWIGDCITRDKLYQLDDSKQDSSRQGRVYRLYCLQRGASAVCQQRGGSASYEKRENLDCRDGTSGSLDVRATGGLGERGSRQARAHTAVRESDCALAAWACGRRKRDRARANC